MNLWDVLILVLLAGVVALAVWKLRRNRGGCSCGCEGCGAKDACRKAGAKERKQ